VTTTEKPTEERREEIASLLLLPRSCAALLPPMLLCWAQGQRRNECLNAPSQRGSHFARAPGVPRAPPLSPPTPLSLSLVAASIDEEGIPPLEECGGGGSQLAADADLLLLLEL
jgi:hypothetical protein